MYELFLLILTIAFWYGIYRLYRHFLPKKNKSFNLSDYYEGSTDPKDILAHHKTPSPLSCDVSHDPETIITCILSNCTDFDIDDPAEQSENFRVAGITFHDFADSSDGIIYGYAQRDPTNPHDANAIALYSWDDRQLGFIPRDQQSDFDDFTLEDTVPLTCYISHFINDEGDFTPSGTVTLYRGTEDALKELLSTILEIDITSLL